MEPPGECRSTFDFCKYLAGALDREELVPWDTLEDFYDYRLQKLGMSWEEFVASTDVHFGPPEFRNRVEAGNNRSAKPIFWPPWPNWSVLR